MNAPLIQGSTEWLAFRQTKRNASETPAIMRVSPFQTWDDIRKAKRFPDKAFKGNAATAHGQQYEEEARNAASFELALDLIPGACYVDGEYACSLDAQADGVIVEIKCPFQGKNSKIWKGVEQGDTLYYYWQIQHQMMLLPGVKKAYLFVYDSETGHSVWTDVYPDEGAQTKIKTAWDAFWAWHLTDDPDPAKEPFVERFDHVWADAAYQFIKAKEEADRYAKIADGYRQTLIDLAETSKERGCGVSVVKTTRAGAVDYKAALAKAAPGFDTAPFKKSDSEVITVKEY